MRRVRIAIAALALGGSVAASAQDSSSVGQAVSNTIESSLVRRGLQSAVANSIIHTNAALLALVGPSALSWFNVIDGLNLPLPFKLSYGSRVDDGRFPDFGGYGGGGFGGAGASGSWGCDEFDYHLDVYGYIVIPSLPLPSGGALKVGTTNPVRTSIGANGVWEAAVTGPQLTKWKLHTYNLAFRGPDKRRWLGAYRLDAGNTFGSSVAYVKGDGTIDPPFGTFFQFGQLGSYAVTNTGHKDCPQSGSGGGDFHFYLRSTPGTSTYSECVMYAPNYTLSKSGYAIADTTSIARGQVDEVYNASAYYGSCPLDIEAIRKLADGLFKAGTQQPNYNGAPYQAIQAQDVKTGGKPPLLADLTENPTAIPTPTAPTNPTPIPTATPTTSPTGTPGSVTINEPDPGVADPSITLTDPTISAFDWGFPTLSLNLGSPACPTYSFEALNQTFTLDSHCPFIDQNRALIAAFMIIIFTVAAGRIILGA